MHLKQNCIRSGNFVVCSGEILPSGFFPLLRATTNNISRHVACNQLDINFRKSEHYQLSNSKTQYFIENDPGSVPRRLSSSNKFHFMNRNPMSVGSPGALDPLYCKGLFTTLAITNNPIERLSESLIVQKVTSAITSFHKKFMVWLLDRNSKSGLIGVGLASCLRTIS
jgi:hypothetical protein